MSSSTVFSITVAPASASAINIPQADFNVWWSRDQYFSGEKELTGFMDYIIGNGLEEEILHEKQEAVQFWKKMEQMAGSIRMTIHTPTAYTV